MSKLITGVVEPSTVDQFWAWVQAQPEVVAAWATISGHIGLIVDLPDLSTGEIWYDKHLKEIPATEIQVGDAPHN